MAQTKKAAAQAAAKKKTAPAGFVTEAQLDAKLDKFADGILGAIEKRLSNVPEKADVVAQATAVQKASPNKFTVNDEWDEEAHKIIGDAVDHTEVVHERNGGIKFTVVIKRELSNAPQQYLDLVGTDRRTKEVGSEGIGGVIEWCKLIKQNLSRPSAANQR